MRRALRWDQCRIDCLIITAAAAILLSGCSPSRYVRFFSNQTTVEQYLQYCQAYKGIEVIGEYRDSESQKVIFSKRLPQSN